MARKLSAAHKAAISLALRRVKGKTTGLDAYVPKPKKPKTPAKPTRASAGSGKKTAVKKTAGKKPAPAKAPAKKTAAKKPAAKAPARKNTLPAPDNSPMPKKKTAATNRPTPKAESLAQARKADAEFKANREARRDSTPFGSIRNSMAEAQLINGRKSDRDRDEDLAEAIQRDSKLTGAEATAKRNAGTAAQLNAAKRRKAALREKTNASSSKSAHDLAKGDEVWWRDGNSVNTEAKAKVLSGPDKDGHYQVQFPGEMPEKVHGGNLLTPAEMNSDVGATGANPRAATLADRTEEMTAALDDLVARPDMSAERRSMAAVDLANDAARLANEASPGEGSEARTLADRAAEIAMRMAESAAANEVTGDRAAAVLAAARKAGRAGRSRTANAPDPRVSGFNTDGLW